jgi:hypothetical protein
MSVENILKVYHGATEAEKAEGMEWYAEAFRESAKLAGTFKTDVKRVVFAIAVMSPNNKWERNINDIVSVIVAYKNGSLKRMNDDFLTGNNKAFKSLYSLTYPANISKAYRILKGELGALNGQKVESFADNIFYRESERVTVDSHAYSVWAGKAMSSKLAQPFITKQYKQVEADYIEAAESVGIKPYQMQAVTWITWRNHRKNKTIDKLLNS